MDAVIMTGGKGTRLAPYTQVLPKGLMPIGGTPLLAHIVRQLHHYGFTSITMACGYLSNLIQAYFMDGSDWGVDIRYVTEAKPLGTVGALKQVEGLDDGFLVINCDVLTSLNLQEFAEFHRQRGSALTIASQQKSIKSSLGVLHIDGEEVVGFEEKPSHSVHVSMGIYMMSTKVMEMIPDNQFFDVPDLIVALLRARHPVRHFENDAYWLDVGTPNDYFTACEQYEEMAPLLHTGEAYGQ